MRLSESLRRNIIEARTGGIINRFKLLKRRNVFFFEELEAAYIQECEQCGYKDHTLKMGYEWMFLVFKTFIPSIAKKISPAFFLNNMIKSLWNNLGLMDSFEIEKSGNEIRITTRNEAITRYIGPNAFTVGSYMGTISALFHSSVHPLKVTQSKHKCEYVYILNKRPPAIVKGKPRDVYWKMNNLKNMKGYTIKDALKNNIFTLADNRIYFRKKHISPVESTIFNIIGEYGILRERIALISHEFFFHIFGENASTNEMLSLLKTLFQIMGWGIINIIVKSKTIAIDITNPPYSLKLTDNWDYIALTFLGYLWHIDKTLKIKNITTSPNTVSFRYESL